MKRLSGLDATFLSLETSRAPMTIGSVSILDPRTPAGRLDVDRLREILRSRLAATPALVRRLASMPFSISRPYWRELKPKDLELGYHVQRTRLPEPGSWRELSELMAWEMSWQLERQQPLWQLLLVEGVDSVPGVPPGSVAIIARVHHAAIDGVSGAEILGALTDVEGAPPSRELQDSGRSEEEYGVSGALDLLERTGRDLARMPATVARILGDSAAGLAGGVLDRAREVDASSDGEPPRLPFGAPRTLLNRRIEQRRSWAPAFIELDRIRAVKNACSATVNDVVLSVCAGALRGWLLSRDKLPKRPLVAMVPISVRRDDDPRAEGNQVSAMLVSLATTTEDPYRRLVEIRDAARSSKVTHQAIGARTLVETAGLLPFALSGLGVRVYSRFHLAERHRPLFNLVITNVPGPPRPVSIAGASLIAHAPAAPVFDGLALTLPVFSYAGTLSFGVTADRGLLGDPWVFAQRLVDSFNELEAAVTLQVP
jgi:WS/DGAT/MGAT family acyltransferase